MSWTPAVRPGRILWVPPKSCSPPPSNLKSPARSERGYITKKEARKRSFLVATRVVGGLVAGEGEDVAEGGCEGRGAARPLQSGGRRRGGPTEEEGVHGEDPKEQEGGGTAQEEEGWNAGA